MEMVTLNQFKQLAIDNNFPIEVLKEAVYGELDNVAKLVYYHQINGLHAVVVKFTKDKTELNITCLRDIKVEKDGYVALPFKDLAYIFLH